MLVGIYIWIALHCVIKSRGSHVFVRGGLRTVSGLGCGRSDTVLFFTPSPTLYRPGIHHVAEVGLPLSLRNCPVLASAVLGFQTWGHHRQRVCFTNQNQKQKHAFWGPKPLLQPRGLFLWGWHKVSPGSLEEGKGRVRISPPPFSLTLLIISACVNSENNRNKRRFPKAAKPKEGRH